MKHVLFLTTLFLLIASTAAAQQFEKIADIPLVTDAGDSRSVNWIDYDNDGDLDLFVTNGPSGGQNNFLYENDGSGSFVKIDSIAITKDKKSSDGSSWGDIDNDGDLDLFVANWYNQNNLLYINNGDKTFSLITSSPVYTNRGYSETGSWADYDRDGDLDLYVANSEGQPKHNFLYNNDGSGIFTKVSTGSLVTDNKASRSVDWADYNMDGWIDLFVANESGQNDMLFKNEGGGFAQQSGIAPVSDAKTTFGSSWGDYDNDGDLDLFTANWGNQNNNLYRNDNGTFTQITEGIIVNDGGHSIGSAWCDIDNDGDLDLFVANGFAGAGNRVPNFLYINNGDGTFIKDSSIVTTETGWTYGAAFGDYNRDGYPDLFAAKCFGANENNVLYKNKGGVNNWLTVQLEGRKSNRSGIGALIKAKANINGNNVVQLRQVTGQTGYCGQTLENYFGFGTAQTIDSLLIIWPSGVWQSLTNVAVNQILKIVEDTTLTSADEYDVVPTGAVLHQNYPNPFNPETTITYSIGERAFVTLKIYDILGREVSTLINGFVEAGNHSINLDASELSAGNYFYQLTVDDKRITKKLTLLK